MAVFAYGKTEKGKLELNEDALKLEKIHDYLILMVADGNGSKAGTLNVGLLAITTMIEYLRKIIKPTTTILEIEQSLDMGMYLCSRVMLGVNAASETLANAYASLTVVVLSESSHEMAFASIGNTEFQLYRRFAFTRMNKVHSEAHDLLLAGEIEEADFYSHPKRGILTSALGGFDKINVDIMHGKLQHNDILFLTTDGIFRHLNPNEMIDAMAKNEIKEGVDAVLKLCVERGGLDNSTLICCYIED